MNKRENITHRKSATRFSDHWDSTLSIIWADHGELRIITVPAGNNVWFTTSGGQSENTRKALKELLMAMRKDNNASPQKDTSNEWHFQSRHDDNNVGELRVEQSAGDMYISAYTANKLHNYLSFSLGFTLSKHTHDALVQLLLAMKKDEEIRPQ